MTRILITGATGFVGSHLVDCLVQNEYELFGVNRTIPQLAPGSKPNLTWYSCDICDQKTLEQIIDLVNPDVIFHLAGVLKSSDAQAFYRVNVQGTVALLEAVIALGLAPKILVANSSAVYGLGTSTKPILEQFDLEPLTHYAVSKAAQEMVTRRYFLTYGLPIICVRTFNLIGPGQSAEFACSAFARQIALAELKQEPVTIATGNLTAFRDFVDVRDAVQAYVLLFKLGQAGQVYNVCCEKAVSIQHCLEILLEMTRIPFTTIVDPTLVQSNDVSYQLGSAAKLYNLTGWKPNITLQQSLAGLLDYWRKKVGGQVGD